MKDYEIYLGDDDMSVGNVALGLSDAIVGTYGPVTRPGQCEMEGDGDCPKGGGEPGGWCTPVPFPNPPIPGGGGCCCCGAGTGSLIDESEIVL